MRQIREILAVDANVKHVEGILVIKMRNIRDLARNYLVFVYSLSA
jgi:hypothetical protein